MDLVPVGLWDVDEHSGQKLEWVDEGLVVEVWSCFGLVEQEPGVAVLANADEGGYETAEDGSL